MWEIAWIILIIGGIIFVDKATIQKPVKAKIHSSYSPCFIESDGTIVCKKDIDTRV